MDASAFMGNQAAWQPVQSNLSSAGAIFVQQEQQRQMVVALQASFSTLPTNKIALLPLDTGGAAANFAALTGLNLKWRAITEAQLVNTATFNASLYPLAFYLGSENYLKTVITTGDARTAITRYLTNGGTLVILASGPFPFYYGYGPNDAPGPADPLLPTLGLPIYIAFETAPPGLSFAVSTNQGIIHSVSSVFPFPPGDPRLRSVNRSQVASSHRYVPWLTVTNSAGTGYGDAACFIEFVHVGALQVFDQLQFEALRVGELADAGGNCFAPGELRGAIAPRSGHEFKLVRFTIRQRANENGLEDAVLPDISGEFGEFGFIELPAWIGLGFLNAPQWNLLHGRNHGRNGVARFDCDCRVHFPFLLFHSFANQYSSGSKSVVCDLEPSVMTQTTWSALVR